MLIAEKEIVTRCCPIAAPTTPTVIVRGLGAKR